jgi:hypothetical protein
MRSQCSPGTRPGRFVIRFFLEGPPPLRASADKSTFRARFGGRVAVPPYLHVKFAASFVLPDPL